MTYRCPLCQQPITTPTVRQWRERIIQRIAEIRRQIEAIERGDLSETIEHQAAAPACTLCTQAAPGKPGQPTPAPSLVAPLRRQLDALEQELNRLK